MSYGHFHLLHSSPRSTHVQHFSSCRKTLQRTTGNSWPFRCESFATTMVVLDINFSTSTRTRCNNKDTAGAPAGILIPASYPRRKDIPALICTSWSTCLLLNMDTAQHRFGDDRGLKAVLEGSWEIPWRKKLMGPIYSRFRIVPCTIPTCQIPKTKEPMNFLKSFIFPKINPFPRYDTRSTHAFLFCPYSIAPWQRLAATSKCRVVDVCWWTKPRASEKEQCVYMLPELRLWFVRLRRLVRHGCAVCFLLVHQICEDARTSAW